MKEEHGRRNNADLDIIGNAPSLTSLKIQFFDGNQIPKKIDSKNVYQLYVKSNFTYHPLEVEKQYLGMWRVTVFIVFESDMPVGTVDIDCQNCELPPYHIEQQSMRHLLVTFNNVLNKAILTIDINKAEKIVNPY